MTSDFSRRRILQVGAGGLAALSLPGSAHAQGAAQGGVWPTKTVRVVVGYPAGGLTDLFARAHADYIQGITGQPIVVENKGGAGGSIAAMDVKRAAPDGYTLMYTIATTLVLNRFTIKDIGYDTEKDFKLVSIFPGSSSPFVAAKKLGVNNLQEFVAWARKNGGTVNAGSYAPGSFGEMVYHEISKEFGINLRPVPYKGEAPMWTDLAAGNIDVAFGSTNAAMVAIEPKLGVPLAMTRQRAVALPGVATFREQGAKSRVFDLGTYQCCVAPAGISQALLDRISGLIIDSYKTDKVRKVHDTYNPTEPPMTPAAAQKMYNDDLPVWIEAAKAMNLKPQ